MAFAAPRAGGGSWIGRGHRRHHFRGAGIGFAAPYYDDDDYAVPYAYSDDGDCWQIRLVRGAYRQVYVCE